MADEWTFVSHAKTTKHNRHGRRKGCGPAGGVGLYKASVDGVTRKQRVGDNDYGRDEIETDILAIMHALENQLNSRCGFAFRLVKSIAMASSYTDAQEGDVQNDVSQKADATNTNQKIISDSHTHLRETPPFREIVAYGIGNFSKGRFQASMLQLACLLLIRRCAAESMSQSTAASTLGSQSPNKDECKNSDDISSSFELEQKRAPIFYYEPNILPVEKSLLETTFHVHVLGSNELGKRTVESMRQQQQQQQQQPAVSMVKTTAEAATTFSKPYRARTLFYMPHCPMRLYCNVLWAHWNHIFPIDKIRDGLLIFGNSFLTYDERTMSSEKRSDPTNGVFSIAPFTEEISVGNVMNRSDIVMDALRHLGTAFNDCNVMSFVERGGTKENTIWLERPMEWIASEDPNQNGELI